MAYSNSLLERIKARFSFRNAKLPRALVIIICALPAVLMVLFFVLRNHSGSMSWVSENISAPVRGFLGMLSSIYPFSLMEVLVSAAIVWLVYYIIKSFTAASRRSGKLKIISKRLLVLAVTVLYVWSLYSWLWNTGYFAPGFAEENGFSGDGVSVAELTAVTKHFAGKADELAPLVVRDDYGNFIEERGKIFDVYSEIYEPITTEFPSLDGRVYRPKSMMFSWLMSRTGYSGVYFALTGEASVNINIPAFLLPATVAHEHAHQLGVYAEEEANFVAVLACISSGNATYEYAGYLMGLMSLLNSLMSTDPETGLEISEGLSELVLRDWQIHYNYWQSQKTVNIGIDFIDTILTAVTNTVSDAVDTVYDSYLKSNAQELGIQSYGAYINLLVEYYITRQLVFAEPPTPACQIPLE